MQLIINLPDREETLAKHRQRWEEVLQDRELASLPGRIETNAYGQIVMSPPARFIHSRRQSKIATLLEAKRGGYAATECAIITSDGAKIADVVWLTPQLFAKVGSQSVLEVAPEICVEILSPSNTSDEIHNKFRLYFEAGAEECWQCDLTGQMTYYLANDVETAHPQSIQCPDFPSQIQDADATSH